MGKSIKIADALEALMPGRKEMMQQGICVACYEPAGPKTHTQAGRDEYRISGTCEECFDAMFKEPEKMSERPAGKTNGDAVDIIDNEGLGYAVQHYISGSEFKDPETARLWQAADDALKALVDYLESETGRKID